MHNPPDFTQIDAILRTLDREIWIVTAADGDRRGGLLATWVSSASIDPERPVLLAGLAPNHFTAELVQRSRAFAAHLLRPNQVELAWNFARDSGRERDKFIGLAITTAETGAPVLKECLAWCDCRVFSMYDTGDRLFFWGDVVVGTLRVPSSENGTRSVPTTLPLREQAFIQSLNSDQRTVLASSRTADVAVQRPWHDNWRRGQPGQSTTDH